MENKFEIGDIVRLKSGGPDMTVTSLDRYIDGVYFCAWFNGNNDLCEASYWDSSLISVTPKNIAGF